VISRVKLQRVGLVVTLFNDWKREKRKKLGEVVRDNACGGQEIISPVSKIPRQWRLVRIMLGVFKYSVRTSQETHYVSTIKPNRLMLFRETDAVHYENHTEHTNTLCGQNKDFYNIYKSSSYLTGKALSPLQNPTG
jgi:hypothetical protein